MSQEHAKQILEKLEKIELLLFGNGHKGICERVRNLELFYKIFAFASVALSIILAVKAL